MSSLFRTPSLAVAALTCLYAIGAAADAPAKPTPAQIAQWVRQLGDDDFSTREEASRKLYEAGHAAESALQGAAHSDDAEVARRAGEIVDKFKWGLYPDAPKQVVDLVTRYRAADRNGKEAVIREILDAGPAGYRTLLKIAGAEDDPTVRGGVLTLITPALSHAAPQMLFEENYDTLELLLEVLLTNDAEQGAGPYAAYWMMRGKLDERIAYFKNIAGKGADGQRSWEILAHLYHAKGDLAAAREAADKAEKPDLADAMLYEAGDWKTLAQRPPHGGDAAPYESLAFQAAYRRLAGDAKGFEDTLADLRKMTDASPGDDFQRFNFAKVLFLNDRPADAIALLSDTADRQPAAFEALAAQMKYKEALALADKAKAAGAADAPALEILKARTLYLLGDKAAGQAIFARYGDDIKEGAADVSWYEGLIEAENKAGLKEQAAAHAARVLTTTRDLGWPGRLFPKLFPKNAEAAETLWAMLRQTRGDQAPEATMKELRDLLGGKADAKAVTALANQVEDGAKNLTPEDADKRRRAVAEVALAANQEATALAALEKAGSAAALLRLGDLYADKKEWDKAATDYGLAWDKDHGQPLALYLSGWAMSRAGKEADGKKRMEQSHWMPLGDGDVRLAFLRSLTERGQHEAARREGELLLRLSPAGSYHAAEGMRQAGLEALGQKDYKTAADGQERSMLRCLKSDISYVQATAYLGVPAFVHRLRAQADTAAGKIDEAKREAALGLVELPGDTFFPIKLVPAWEKAGHSKEAAELFEQCITAQEKFCADYPDCPWAHNSAAWTSVCCRRNLDHALDHALKAVALAPDSAGNLDTLAEVYFQRGDKEKAVATQKKAAALEPKRPYFRKQLQRIEAGDPKAERPAEDDDDD